MEPQSLLIDHRVRGQVIFHGRWFTIKTCCQPCIVSSSEAARKLRQQVNDSGDETLLNRAYDYFRVIGQHVAD
jgi:hypothetical protein